MQHNPEYAHSVRHGRRWRPHRISDSIQQRPQCHRTLRHTHSAQVTAFFSFSAFLFLAFAVLDSRRVCGVWYLQARQLGALIFGNVTHVTSFFSCIPARAVLHSVIFMDGARDTLGLASSSGSNARSIRQKHVLFFSFQGSCYAARSIFPLNRDRAAFLP
jgi:hypothetical protein